MNNKLKDFFELLDDLRNKVYSEFSIKDIFNVLDEKFDFITKFSMLPNGEESRQTILKYIDSFEGTEYNFNLDKYLNYVENFEQNSKFSSSLNSSDNCVKIETIHASKGLEYPVVFLCGLDKGFSNQTFVSPVLKDNSLGLAISSYDFNNYKKEENLAKQAVIVNLRKKEKAEELRLLYVALTRAKNNLILIGECNLKTLKRIDNFKEAQTVSSFLPWVVSGISNIGFNAIKNGKKNFVDKNDGFEVDVEIKTDDDFVLQDHKEKDVQFLFTSNAKAKDLKEILNISIEKKSNIALKNSVSSILKEQSDENMSSYNIEPKKLTIFESFIDKSKLGTIYHKIMQEVDFLNNKCTEKEYLQSIIDNLNLDQDYLNEINIEKVGKCASCIKNLNPIFILKEQQFLSLLKYNDIIEKSDIEDKVLIQGVADLLVKNNEGYFLIDYKTNVVESSDQLVEKYKLQLKIYKNCLEKAINIKINNSYIYSFYLDKLIKID